MDRDQAYETWPDAEDLISDTFATQTGSYARPAATRSCGATASASASAIVQCHWQERNEWWVATLTRVGFLAEPMKSPFLEQQGQLNVRPHHGVARTSIGRTIVTAWSAT